jgi:hypothetical protein
MRILYLCLKVHKIDIFLATILKFVLFLVSYVKILRFYQKNFDWAIIGGGTIFPRSPWTTQNGKKF